jgi:NAD(P)-dependent dehydrogenase (short-subunit alcohol dehydrogenase family)
MKLAGKVVVITGSGGGIGEGCARRFAAEGAKVVVTDIDPAGVERVSSAIGSVGLAADIRQESGVRAVADLARRTYGEVDVWFSNAGVSGPSQFGKVQENAQWETAWDLHVMSHVYAAREVLPSMLERGDGYLLQTASVIALALEADKAAYSVTKHAALSLAEWLAASYRKRGIKVSCFCPGPMATPMLLEGYPDPEHPVRKRALTPEQVADLLVKAIDSEQFLILDSSIGPDSLQAKLTDYEGWIDKQAERVPE